MEQSLNLTQAAKLVGCSRNTLYAAIRSGRLRCVMGGRPGTRTEVTVNALRDAGFSIPAGLGETERPPKRPTHLERAERLERYERTERPHYPVQPDFLNVSTARAEHDQPVAQFERAVERLERSMDLMFERLGERLERAFEHDIERALERTVERLVDRRLRDVGPVIEVRPLRQASAAAPPAKGAIVGRIRQMHDEERLSCQAIANRFNSEGLPTLSGRGQWRAGTVANLLAQARGAAE